MYKIFVSALAFDEGKSGISNYIENCVYELAKKNKIYLVILESDIKNYRKKSKNIEFIKIPNIIKNPIFSLIFHLFILPFFVKKDCDFIFLPAGNRRLFAFYPKYTITTFHDLSQFYVKNKYDNSRMFYIKKVVPFFLRSVDKILSVSTNTKNDLIKFYKIDCKKIEVSFNGYDKEIFKPQNTKVLMNDYKIEKEYFLYVARIEHPAKNHLNLIKAYELLDEKIKEKYDLVLVGANKENAHIVNEYISNSKDKNNIKVLGFIKNDDLPRFYKNAKLYIFPSFYEGFGIPLAEAMACGIPTLCARNSSLVEIGENASLFFNEYSCEDIKNKIESVLSDSALETELIKKGLEKKNQFDWSCHGNKIIKIYENR